MVGQKSMVKKKTINQYLYLLFLPLSVVKPRQSFKI